MPSLVARRNGRNSPRPHGRGRYFALHRGGRFAKPSRSVTAKRTAPLGGKIGAEKGPEKTGGKIKTTSETDGKAPLCRAVRRTRDPLPRERGGTAGGIGYAESLAVRRNRKGGRQGGRGSVAPQPKHTPDESPPLCR